MVTTDNYEEYLMMQADGELNAQELAALEAFLRTHPGLAAEAATWQDLRLVPDESIRYENQESLIREDRKAVAFRPWHIAVPAAAAILLALFMIPRTSTRDVPAPSRQLTSNSAPTATTTENDLPETPQPVTHALPVPNPPVPVKTYPRPRRRPAAAIAAVQPSGAEAPRSESIRELLPQQVQGLSAAAAERPRLLAMSPETPQPGPGADQAGNRVRVQFAAANQEALDAMKAGLDQRIEQIGRVAKSVRETTVVLKLGGNAFNIHL